VVVSACVTVPRMSRSATQDEDYPNASPTGADGEIVSAAPISQTGEVEKED